MYAGPKATLRPFHDQVVELTRGFGADVEVAPKQAYVSLRRSKQFGTVGPDRGAARDRPESPRRGASRPAGGRPRDVHAPGPAVIAEELDAEVIGWLREAYERA